MSASIRKGRGPVAPPPLRPLPLPRAGGSVSLVAAPVALAAAPRARARVGRAVDGLGPPTAAPGARSAPDARAVALLRQAHRSASPALGAAVRDMLDAADALLAMEGELRVAARGWLRP